MGIYMFLLIQQTAKTESEQVGAYIARMTAVKQTLPFSPGSTTVLYWS
jgi:hypothetical protein